MLFPDKVTFPETADAPVKYAVILAKYNGKYVFVKHRERDTIELPGGHREQGETIEQTAARELYEETGALKYSLRQICLYKLDSFGTLFYAEITELGELPPTEIERIILLDEPPADTARWTYPEVHPKLLERIESEL